MPVTLGVAPGACPRALGNSPTGSWGFFMTQAVTDARIKAHQEKAEIDPLGGLDACFSRFVILAGAVIGGAIGMMVGSAVGAGAATGESGSGPSSPCCGIPGGGTGPTQKADRRAGAGQGQRPRQTRIR
jgi:hypothetical protein